MVVTKTAFAFLPIRRIYYSNHNTVPNSDALVIIIIIIIYLNYYNYLQPGVDVINIKYSHQVTFAYMKHLWQAGKKQVAFDTLSQFVTMQTTAGSTSSASGVGLTPEMIDNRTQKEKLLARYMHICLCGHNSFSKI